MFDGFTLPTYTQVPDELFDVLLAELNNEELRVLLYIIRRTFGFKKSQDAIALSQFVSGITTSDGRTLDSGTGLSKSAVARGLQKLQERGVIVSQRQASKERGNEPTLYRLRFKGDALVPDTGQASPNGASPLVPPEDPQQTVLQEEGAGDYEAFYELVKIELCSQMSKANYETWIRDTRLTSWNGQQAVISAPTEYQAHWLEERFPAHILKAFEKVHKTRPQLRIVWNGHV